MKQRRGGTTIYALCDPTTLEIRYIGKTVRPAVRLRAHVYDATSGAKTHCARWIRRVGSPIMRSLVVVPDDYGAEMETRAVSHFRALGFRLTNLTDGGDGATGLIHSAETRARIGAANLGRNLGRILAPRSAEYRAKMSAALRGRKQSASTRDLLRAKAIGRVLSPETRAKIGAASIAGLTPERRAKISAGNRAKAPFTSEHRVKLGLASTGRRHSAEVRAKIADAQRAAWAREGYRESRREKLSQAQRAAWVRRKAVA